MDASTKIVSDEEIIEFLKNSKIEYVKYEPAKIVETNLTVSEMISSVDEETLFYISGDDYFRRTETFVSSEDAKVYPMYKFWESDSIYRVFSFEKLIEFVKLAIIAKRNTNVSHG